MYNLFHIEETLLFAFIELHDVADDHVNDPRQEKCVLL